MSSRSLPLIVLVYLLLSGCAAPAPNVDATSPLPERYRDVRIYATSAPAPGDATTFMLTVWVENHGKETIDADMSLEANAVLGLPAAHWTALSPSGGNSKTSIPFKPTTAVKREIVHGEVRFSGLVDRDLFIAVQGPDPAGFKSDGVDPITVGAEAVAAYAPRTLDRVHRIMQARPVAKKTIALATDGKSDYHIHAPFQTGAALLPAQRELIDALADLQRCIAIQSGATLPILSENNAPGRAIRLVKDGPLLSDGRHTNENYRLHVEPDGDVAITSPTFEGLRHGVYGLLSDHLDCHWFLPKKLGEEVAVSADKTVRIPSDLDETRTPSWYSVTGMSWGQAREWDLRNRSIINRGRMSFGHAWTGYVNAAEFPYDKFPDMWARDEKGKILLYDKGWTSTNFCSTSPKVIEVVAAKVNAFFKANPEAIVASLDPNDLAPFCECERCKAVDRSYGITEQDGEHMSDRLLHFSKQIADRLDPAFKNRFLGVLAYGHQTNPPVSAQAPPQHATIVCDFPPYFDHTRPFDDPTSRWNKGFEKSLGEWAKALHGGNLGFYDYYGQYSFFGPWGIIHKMREDLPAFQERGGTFLVIEAQPNFAINGLNLYISSRLAWDVDTDVDVAMEEFFTKFYGPSADAMRSFWLGAEKWYALERPGRRAAQRVGQHEDFWRELDASLKAAEAAAADAPQRFRDRIAFVRDGFEYGRGAHELTRLIPRHGKPTDIPASIRFLESRRASVEAAQSKYTPQSDYWPIMLPAYFYPEFDAMIKVLKDAQTNAESQKKLGESLEALTP
jgi:hypothetical protein